MNHPAIVVVIVAAVVLAIVGYLYSRFRRSRLLRERFGPEYDRVVGQENSRRRAEEVLEFRETARGMLRIRPLSHAERQAFSDRWSAVQRQFVDDPPEAVVRADRLVSELMEARGYPVDSFEQRSELISVDHPVVVQNYRRAHDIALRQRGGRVSTEDLRKAMVHYRTLFDELLHDPEIERMERKEARG
jgi:hypothetical protein